MAKKSSEVIAEPGNLAARLDPGYTEIVAKQEGRADIRIRLKPLTYLQRVYCDSVKARGMRFERDATGKVIDYDFSPDSWTEYVQWILRLGIESVEGVEWTLETIRVAGRVCSCVKLECLDALPDELQAAACLQIQSLSELSEGERVKLDFTSPLHAEAVESATASSA